MSLGVLDTLIAPEPTRHFEYVPLNV